MGNPPDSDFTAGVQCVNFETAFGESTTPLILKVVFADMVICAPYPNPPENGIYFITQDVNPCRWIGFGITGVVFLDFSGAGAIDLSDTAFPLGLWFNAGGIADSYINANTCPGFAATGGTAIITWGPEIPRL